MGTGSIASNQTCPHSLCHATVFAIGAGHTLHLLTVAAVADDDHTGILRFYPVKGLALKAGIQSDLLLCLCTSVLLIIFSINFTIEGSFYIFNFFI